MPTSTSPSPMNESERHTPASPAMSSRNTFATVISTTATAQSRTGAERNPSLPDLPTVAETIPGYEISQSWGAVAPAGTPATIIARLNDSIAGAMNLSAVKEQVLKTGALPAGDSPAAFAAFMAKERERLGEVIERSGIVLAD